MKKRFFQKIFNITDPEILNAFCGASSLEHVSKGSFLVKEGVFHPNFYFLKEGILRGFWNNSTGKEATECFIFRYGQPAMGSYRFHTPAAVSIIAETDSLVMQVAKEKISSLIFAYPKLLSTYNELLIREMEEQQRIKHTIYMLDAQARYQWFQEEYPNLPALVSFKHIASFLNMSPVTLSRVRCSLDAE